MKNMRVSKKLIVGFGIMILLSTIIGAAGIIGMSFLNNSATKLYDSNVIAIKAMGNLRELFGNERNDLRAILLAQDDPAQLQSLIAKFTVYDKTATDNFTLYETTIEDDAEERSYYTAKEAWLGPYADMKKEFLAQVAAGNFEEANRIFQEGASVITPITNGFTESAAQNDTWASETNQETDSLYARLFIVMVAVFVFAVIIACVLAFYISGIISKPLNFMRNVLHMMGIEGVVDFTDEEYRQAEMYAQSKDEVGESIQMLIQTGRRLEKVGESLETVASGDLTVELSLLSERDTIGRSLKEMLNSLNIMFGEIRTASDQVSSGADQVSSGAQGLASGSSEQAASIEELSAALAELQEKTDNNNKDSAAAREANGQTANKLEDSIRSMSEMLEAMKSIDESSSSITKVIKVIDDIAFQTNILALNAAVEAARAGQHGKGFAVVADEVRSLAAKSAEAAKETSALIAGSTERVKQGNEIVAKTNSNLEEAVENAQKSTRLIEQVARASADQAKSIVEINQGMEQISAVVQGNSATAEQSAAASEEMSAQANLMNEIVAKFKLR